MKKEEIMKISKTVTVREFLHLWLHIFGSFMMAFFLTLFIELVYHTITDSFQKTAMTKEAAIAKSPKKTKSFYSPTESTQRPWITILFYLLLGIFFIFISFKNRLGLGLMNTGYFLTLESLLSLLPFNFMKTKVISGGLDPHLGIVSLFGLIFGLVALNVALIVAYFFQEKSLKKHTCFRIPSFCTHSLWNRMS